MPSTTVDLDEELAGLLGEPGQPVQAAARELIVVELYRRNLVSSGKAAALLGIPHLDFIQRASQLGIPYFRFTEDEWNAEVAESKRT
jgi:predicted HTH domain antitoxin